MSALHSLELLAPFITLGSQRTDELTITIVQTRMFLVDLGLSLANNRQALTKVLVQLLDRSHSFLPRDSRLKNFRITGSPPLEMDSTAFTYGAAQHIRFVAISAVQFCSLESGAELRSTWEDRNTFEAFGMRLHPPCTHLKMSHVIYWPSIARSLGKDFSTSSQASRIASASVFPMNR